MNMNNKIIFLRHAKTKVDNTLPIADWFLTDDGVKHAKEVSSDPIFDDVDLIFASTERKAVDTAKPITERLGKEIIQVENLGEIKRPNAEKITLEEYKRLKSIVFSDFDKSESGWETVNRALSRFSKAVEEIDRKYENKVILIVAHGTVMSLYFANIQGKMDELFSRWKSLGFCEWGVVENGKVTRDIV